MSNVKNFLNIFKQSNIVKKPLIIHTRSAPDHTLSLLKEGLAES